MPIVTRCEVAGCRTLTIGRVCLEHEARSRRVVTDGLGGNHPDGVDQSVPPALSSPPRSSDAEEDNAG
jgi:hypothetical protein